MKTQLTNKPSDAAAQPEPINARLVYQYRRAESAKGQFVREATAFGVMLMEAEKDIRAAYFSTAVEKYKTSKKGRWGEGRPNSGIEGWLAENCPEIAYKTALSYKALAQKVVEMMGGPQPAVLAALAAPSELQITYETFDDEGQDQVPSTIIEEREAIFADATSRRKLEQMYFNFEHRQEKAEMMAQSSAKPVPVPKLKASDEAAAIWTGVMRVLDKSAVMDAVPLLDEKATRVCLGRLGDLYTALKRHLKEFRG